MRHWDCQDDKPLVPLTVTTAARSLRTVRRGEVVLSFLTMECAMKTTGMLGGLALAAGLCGCVSQQQQVDEMQADATQVAQQRGKFELNCPSATASVLSKEMIQSAITNPRWAPPERAEYTVGVAGCNQRATYLVVCAVGGTGCVAAGAQNQIH
jgi:hypothetical protein